MGHRSDICPRSHDKRAVGRKEDGSCLACWRASELRRKESGWNKKRRLRKMFGLSLEDWNKMFVSQSGLCRGCYKHASELKRGLFVDHDHKSNRVRGLLCTNCNTALGLTYDNPEVLLRLAEYVRHDGSGS